MPAGVGQGVLQREDGVVEGPGGDAWQKPARFLQTWGSFDDEVHGDHK